LIGKGSFGRVYHAFHVEAGEWIAVKQVDLPTTKADYANSQLRENKDALFREISLLEDLDNEYIVQYLGYDVDESEGHINIFLEYVPGGSIASCLSKTGKFAVPLVRFLTQQILMGLAYLHNRNILHRVGSTAKKRTSI
jgi:serine/threonine protein kinase